LLHVPKLASRRGSIRKQSDGDFELDVVARFPAFGVNVQMLIECKHLRRKDRGGAHRV
jgi:hypothetical protein